ncbi:MAG TPA: hypothetical protein VFG62_07480 [Rhodopila sp.]|jgi:hypothetical protein|nr:hypothetical protein [Rhodopila sp.]
MPVKTYPFDAARYLDSDLARSVFMTEALETNDPAFIAHAVEVVARSRVVRHDLEAEYDPGIAPPPASKQPDLDLGKLLETIRDLGLCLTAKRVA